MNISQLCIQRPVFATVMSLILTLVGLVSYERLAVREFPNVDTPHGHRFNTLSRRGRQNC